MAKRDVEEQIRALSRLREAPVSGMTLAALRKGLSDPINLVCARAAQVTGDLGAKSLIPALISCFDRFFKNCGDADPQCWAKNAIAKALTDLGYDESAPFMRGCRYVQMESVWGGKSDTAVTLRSLCTLALVQCADLPRAEKLRHLVVSLTDREETVRVDAIRAIEQMDGEEAALLMRLKAGMGDKRAVVIGQALESLLRLEGTRAVAFVREFLVERPRENLREMNSSEEEVVEEAALALGGARLPAAVDELQAAWRREPKVVFLHAISASRHESGFEFLLELVKTGRERDAADGIEALALHRDSLDVRARVEAAVGLRGSAALGEKFELAFIVR